MSNIAVEENFLLEEDDSSFDEQKVYCANCENCILFKQLSPEAKNSYHLRVRCSAGMWNKKKGGEKYYKYFTVARRKLDECNAYLPMGEPKEFLKELKKNLPITDESYSFMPEK